MLAQTYDLLAYERWLRETHPKTPSGSYLFLESRVRFTLEPDDRLSLVPGVRLERQANRVALHHEVTNTRDFVDGLAPKTVERIVSSIDGKRSVIAVQLSSAVTAKELDAFLRSTFGRFVLCPETVNEFETRLPAYGLVRFPCSPYEVDRYYWANSIAVRDAWHSAPHNTFDSAAFATHLKHLHVLLLLGASRRSFYRPSSPIVNQAGARAGAFYDVPTKTLRDLDLTLFIDGPRVSAPFVGGRYYHELLARSLEDPDALLDEREIHDEQRLAWGSVTRGQARHDPAPDAWFIPPRPITAEHIEALRALHDDAWTDGKRSEAERLTAIARFHYGFVRLHPFTCANQSLAMNLVNGLLERLGRAALPHLILDQLALRLSPTAYTRLFRRAVAAWLPSSALPHERLRELVAKRAQMDQLVAQLNPTLVREGIERRLHEHPEAARLALLREP